MLEVGRMASVDLTGTAVKWQVIQDLKFTCPKDWQGFRELTSK